MASCLLIMNHLDDLDLKRGISWSATCFMLGEVQFQVNTAKGILDQPRESSGSKVGETREAVVSRICGDNQEKKAIIKLGGLQLMNIFHRQEIDRIQKILSMINKYYFC